jgi:Protein of unknown function (DUF1580)
MIDVQREQPISFNEAAKFLPDGRRPGFSTWWRWSTKGIHGVKLETLLVGGRRCTSADAVARFFERTTAAASGESAQPAARTNRQRQAAIKKAEAECAAAGI